MHATSLRLAHAVTTAEIPQWLRSLRSANTRKYDKRVIHVTGEQLCDDALRLLKPTLPPPGTCDVIDLNPGPCLWSEKLHELIKPRRHVLIEPYRDIYAARIDALLAQPNSRYRYATSMAAALDPQARLLSDEVYHFNTMLTKNGGPEYKLNEQLLFTANLSAAARLAKGFTGSIAKQFLNEYYRALFVRDDFMHKYGLLRLLAWVEEDSRKSIMPTTVNSRTKQSIQLETTCVVDQIASPSVYQNLIPHQKRWYELDIECQSHARQSQEALKIEMPSSRTQPAPVPPFTSLNPSIEQVRKVRTRYPHNQTYIQNLLELDDELANNDPEWYTSYQEGLLQRSDKGNKTFERMASTPRQKQYRLYVNQLRTHHNTYLKCKDYIGEQRHLHNAMQREYIEGLSFAETNLPAAGQRQEAAKKLMRRDDELNDRLAGVKHDTQHLLTKTIDDYRCWDSRSKVLAWNRRRHDPLFVHEDEFTPRSPLTLFDFKPDATALTKLNTIDKQICFDHVCTTLTLHPVHTIRKGLEQLIPAGLDQFLERVPELSDPMKGGWYNLDHARVRTMHSDLYIAIAMAFYGWPHRPSIDKLLSVYQNVYQKGPR